MRDAGVLGAALMAGVASGTFTSLHKAAKEFVQMDATFSPHAAEQARHERRFGQYKLLYKQLVPFNASLQ